MHRLPTLLIGALAFATTAAAVPLELVHQGRLADAAGGAINGELATTVVIRDGESGETVWTWLGTVPFEDGVYSVRLDGGTPPLAPSMFDAAELELVITVDGTEMAPQPLGSAAMALRADTATHVDGGMVAATQVQLLDQTAAPPTCNEGATGTMAYFDGTVQLCNNGSWAPVASAVSNTEQGADCQAIHLANPTLPSGYYGIDPDGAGGNARFIAYCDMTTASGGWTLIARDRLNDGSLQYVADVVWPTAGGGDAQQVGDYIMGASQLTSLEAGSANHSYLVLATGTRTTPGQYITCTQDDPITKIGRPENGSCAYNGGSSEEEFRDGISMHDSGNCQFIAFWRTGSGAGSWWQGSNFAPANTADVCSTGWGTDYPHSLGPNPHQAPYPQRNSDYTTWFFVR